MSGETVHPGMGIHSQQFPDGSWGHMVTDALGSVREVVDENINSLEARAYDPYGNVLSQQGTPQTPFGFTGEPTDPNDLIHLRARYLDPALGTFPNPDPLPGNIQEAMSLNPYSYVQGNPVNMADPSGMVPVAPSDLAGCGPQSEEPPTTQPTVCEQFIEHLRFTIDSELRRHGCAPGPLNEPSECANRLTPAIAVSLRETYNPPTGEIFGLPRVAGFNRPPTFAHPMNDPTNAEGISLRERYGFRREWFHNTHHFFGVLGLAAEGHSGSLPGIGDFTYGGSAVAQHGNNWFESESLRCRAVQRCQNIQGTSSGMTADDYEYFYNEGLIDLDLGRQAAVLWAQMEHGIPGPDNTLNFHTDIRHLPDKLAAWACAGSEDEIWAGLSDILDNPSYRDVLSSLRPSRIEGDAETCQTLMNDTNLVARVANNECPAPYRN